MENLKIEIPSPTTSTNTNVPSIKKYVDLDNVDLDNVDLDSVDLDIFQPIRVDFVKERQNRQQSNNINVYRAIMDNDMETFHKITNAHEIERVLKEINNINNIPLSLDELLENVKRDMFKCIIFAGRIAKNSSRQGSKDEALQIDVCAKTADKCGIKIENLSSVAFRAMKNEKSILSNTEFKERKINKSETLKSFDAKISGNLNGWLCAKVCYGSGGHQDNVFEEMYNYCEWVDKYYNDTNNEELFVCLIDTDLTRQFDELKNKYSHIKNLLIVNHVDFQYYLFDYNEKKKKEKTNNLYQTYGYDILDYLKNTAVI